MAKRRPAGDGMVRKRDDGRWEGRIVVGHKKNGDPIHRYVLARTQKELMKKLHDHIEMYRDADLTEDCNMMLGEWLDRWINEYMIFTVRETTLDAYKAMIKIRSSRISATGLCRRCPHKRYKNFITQSKSTAEYEWTNFTEQSLLTA